MAENETSPDKETGDLPDVESLPPVTPPSAGFIVQLFLVPAVIVMAIVGVWALFGRLAATNHDVEDLVVELRSNNKHRRDRAMVSLAQSIEADRALGDEGQQLASQPAVATELVNVFRDRLDGVREIDEIRVPKGEGGDALRRRTESARERERLKSLTMTARALGLLDVPRVVAPALMEGMDREHDPEVRKDCINSISVIASRATENEDDELLAELAATPGLVEALIDVTFDPGDESAEMLRDTATFGLGLLPTDEARDRLLVLAEHANAETRYNAAIGLARQNSTAGLPVFASILERAADIPEGETATAQQPMNLLVVTLLAATFTSLIMAAANKGAVRYVGAGLSVVLLIAAGAAVAQTAPERSEQTAERPVVNPEVREEQMVERVLALHAVQNSLKATARLAPELSEEERSRFERLVQPIAKNHPEPRLRVDAARTLSILRRAG